MTHAHVEVARNTRSATVHNRSVGQAWYTNCMKRLGFIVLFTVFALTTLWAYARVTETEIAIKTRQQQTGVYEVPERLQAQVVKFLGEPVFMYR